MDCANANKSANDIAPTRAILIENVSETGEKCLRHCHACRNCDVQSLSDGKRMPKDSLPGEFPDHNLDYYLPPILIAKIQCCNSNRDGGRGLPVNAVQYVLRIGFVELRTQRKQTLGGSR
jgi:hypothetical protein